MMKRFLAAWMCLALVVLAPPGSAMSAQRGKNADSIAIAAITIYPGDIIRPGMVRMKPVPSRYARSGVYITDPRRIYGKMARRTLVRNRPVLPGALREPYAVRNGKTVRILYRNGALTITALGTALESASDGELVTVRNVDTGRIIHGVARKGGLVVVESR